MATRKYQNYFTNPYRLGTVPATSSSFEQVVQNLHLLPDQYSESAELKAWVKKNKRYRYVPPDILEMFGFEPGTEI